jgi:hypothetical protein
LVLSEERGEGMVLGDSLFVLMLVMEGVGAYATVIGGTFYLASGRRICFLQS